MRLKGKNKPNIAFLNHMIDDALAELPLFFENVYTLKMLLPLSKFRVEIAFRVFASMDFL